MKQEGAFYGVNGSYSYFIIDDLSIQPELRIIRGKEKYSSKQSGALKIYVVIFLKYEFYL